MGKNYSISQLAELYQIPVSTLRYYQRIHLFEPLLKDERNGYGFYSSEQCNVLTIIIFLRSLNLPVSSIKEIVARQPNRTELLEILKKYHVSVKKELERLTENERRLREICQNESVINERNSYFFEHPVVVPYVRRIFLYKKCAPYCPKDINERFIAFKKYSHTDLLPDNDFNFSAKASGYGFSLREYRRNGDICYKYIYLEPCRYVESSIWNICSFVDANYLTIHYRKFENRDNACRILMRFMEENHIVPVDDMVIDLVHNKCLPPLDNDEAVFELCVRI